MLHKFTVEINTDEATTEELHSAIYHSLRVLELQNGDTFYADNRRVEVSTDLTPND